MLCLRTGETISMHVYKCIYIYIQYIYIDIYIYMENKPEAKKGETQTCI